MEMPVNVMPPTDRADTGQEAHPIMNKNEDEKGNEQRESGWEGFFADDRFEQIPKAFEQGFKNRLSFRG